MDQAEFEFKEDELMQKYLQEKHKMKALDVTHWKEMSLRLKKLKADEAELRRDICAAVIAGAEMVDGRVTVKDHIEGFAVKAVQALSYTIDVAALGAIWEALSPEEQDAVVMKPALSLAKYKKLPEDSLIHEAVVSRLSMPTLSAEQEEL